MKINGLNASLEIAKSSIAIMLLGKDGIKSPKLNYQSVIKALELSKPPTDYGSKLKDMFDIRANRGYEIKIS